RRRRGGRGAQPAALSAARRRRGRRGDCSGGRGMTAEWEYVPEGFARAVRGWDVAAIEEAYRRRWPEFVAATRGPEPLGVAHEVPLGANVVRDDPSWHNAVLTFGYVLARAGRDRD